MPSQTHQTLVLLFRDHPELVLELARRAGAPLGEGYERMEEIIPEFDNPLAARSAMADLALAGMLDDESFGRDHHAGDGSDSARSRRGSRRLCVGGSGGGDAREGAAGGP
jgi:hypothetical protein